jgi:hypothetical protein
MKAPTVKFTGVLGLDAGSLLYKTENASSLMAGKTMFAKSLHQEFSTIFLTLGLRFRKLSCSVIC